MANQKLAKIREVYKDKRIQVATAAIVGGGAGAFAGGFLQGYLNGGKDASAALNSDNSVPYMRALGAKDGDVTGETGIPTGVAIGAAVTAAGFMVGLSKNSGVAIAALGAGIAGGAYAKGSAFKQDT